MSASPSSPMGIKKQKREEDDSGNGDDVWIYHERQEARLCGQHALNNLVQSAAFTVGWLSEIAHALDQAELATFAERNEQQGDDSVASKDFLRRLQEGSGNVDASGNFSIQVLQAALEGRYQIRLPHLSEKDLWKNHPDKKDVTDFQGFLCHQHDHWFAVRKLGGRFWNLNSLAERPTPVSHFAVATELANAQKDGYTVFCVPDGLPSAGNKPALWEAPGAGTWHRMSHLLNNNSTSADVSTLGDTKKAAVATDPWKGVGTGMRLDGKDPNAVSVSSSSSAAASLPPIPPENMTEEEQLQWAMMQSTAEAEAALEAETPAVVAEEVPPEPASDDPQSVRLQIKWPDGKRTVRRFHSTQTVQAVYAYCRSEIAANAASKLQLRFGFPPKDLASLDGELTIRDAKLAGESLQASIV